MLGRTLAILALLGTALVPLAVATPVQAQACPTPFWGIYCNVYVSSDFGPVTRATQISSDGRVRYGNYSSLTRAFLPATEWQPIFSERWLHVKNVHSTDDYYATFHGYTSIASAYGEIVFGTQVLEYGTVPVLARWGIYNVNSNTFYPDATGIASWQPVVSP